MVCPDAPDKRRSRLAQALTFVCLANFALVAGPAAETAQQRGKRVVDQALQALGGDAFLHMEDRVETGRAYSFYNQQISGLSIAKIYTRYLSQPVPPVTGKLLVRERDVFGRESFGKDGTAFTLFTEDAACEANYHGARPLEPDRWANYQNSTLHNIFYILRQRLGEPGLDFYSQGSDRYENFPVDIVDITGADNITVTVYFDQFTHLPVRQVYKRRNETYHDFDTEVSLFAKYKDVGGIKWPWDIRRERNGQKIYEMFSDSVEINKNLLDNLFALPSNIKTMK
jgi:hypothetical protein